ncbi:MAG: hypothetical protein QXI31_00080 [Archaeoglobaceae archaeon]
MKITGDLVEINDNKSKREIIKIPVYGRKDRIHGWVYFSGFKILERWEGLYLRKLAEIEVSFPVSYKSVKSGIVVFPSNSETGFDSLHFFSLEGFLRKIIWDDSILEIDTWGFWLFELPESCIATGYYRPVGTRKVDSRVFLLTRKKEGKIHLIREKSFRLPPKLVYDLETRKLVEIEED